MPIPTFPPELIRETLKYLSLGTAGLTAAEPDKGTFSTFHACSLVSKDFFHEAQPLVYSRVDIVETVTQYPSTSKKLQYLARSLQSNPDLAKHVRSFNLTVSGTGSSGRRLPDQPSEALAFLLHLFSELVSLSLQVTGGWRLSWSQVAPSLQEAIARAFERNQDSLTSVRLAKIGAPAALWLALPNLTSVHLARNPPPLIKGKNFLGFDQYPDHPDIEQREMARNIKARVSSFECIDDPFIVAQIAHDAPQVLSETKTLSVEVSRLDDPQACLNFRMLLDAASPVVEHLKVTFCSERRPEPITAPHLQRLKKLEMRWEHSSDGYLHSFFVPFCTSMVARSHATLEDVGIAVFRRYSFPSEEKYLRKELNYALRRITPCPYNLRSATLNGICVCAFASIGNALCSECKHSDAAV